jgi:hypothetical protein
MSQQNMRTTFTVPFHMDNSTMTIYHRAGPVTYVQVLTYLIVTFVLLCIKHAGPLDRPVLPRGSPNLWSAYHWPFIGSAWRFFRSRREMLLDGMHAVPDGIFSFYVFRKHVVHLSGVEGRKTFFHVDGLGTVQGYDRPSPPYLVSRTCYA